MANETGISWKTKIKNFFFFGKQKNTTSGDLSTALTREHPLTDADKKELVKKYATSTDAQKTDYFKTMLYIAYARDGVLQNNKHDTKECLAMDIFGNIFKDCYKDYKSEAPCPVVSKLVKFNSVEMKDHLKEFVKLLSEEERIKLAQICMSAIDTLLLDDKNKDQNSKAADFIKEEVLPLFSTQERDDSIVSTHGEFLKIAEKIDNGSTISQEEKNSVIDFIKSQKKGVIYENESRKLKPGTLVKVLLNNENLHKEYIKKYEEHIVPTRLIDIARRQDELEYELFFIEQNSDIKFDYDYAKEGYYRKEAA